MLSFDMQRMITEPDATEASVDAITAHLDQSAQRTKGQPLTLEYAEAREQSRNLAYHEGGLALQAAAAALSATTPDQVSGNAYLAKAESLAAQLKTQAGKLAVVAGKASTRHDSESRAAARTFMLEASRVKTRWLLFMGRQADLLATLTDSTDPELANSLYASASEYYAKLAQSQHLGILAVDLYSAHLRHEIAVGNVAAAKTLHEQTILALKGIASTPVQYAQAERLLRQRNYRYDDPAAARASILAQP